jgi:hypothetical protein
VAFDDFHKNSASIIRASVFGLDENKKIKKQFFFPQNNLTITNVDIQGKNFETKIFVLNFLFISLTIIKLSSPLIKEQEIHCKNQCN